MALALEHVREHGDALVRAGRTAVWVRRGDHDNEIAVDQNIETLAQELRLRPGLPGVWHRLGGRLRIARHGLVFEVDAGGDHEAVVGQPPPVDEPHRLALTVDHARPLVDDPHALARHLVVVVGDRIVAAKAPDAEIGEEAGGEKLLRLDQRDVDRARGLPVDMARRRTATRPAADDDARFGLACPKTRGAYSETAAIDASAVKLRRVRRGMAILLG